MYKVYFLFIQFIFLLPIALADCKSSDNILTTQPCSNSVSLGFSETGDTTKKNVDTLKNSHTCAVSDKKLYCWGNNQYGWSICLRYIIQ